MFTPKSGTGFPSSASGRAIASGGRRRTSVGGLGMGGSKGTPRSPYATPSGRNTPTLGTPGGSTLNQFSIESFGSALPALVKEALTFSEKNCEMSAVLSSCGWAWLVVGRRLLVWHYTAGQLFI
ncbi:Nucleoporin Nup133/Nup155-like N-terminal [Trinorchestia longiramus]|nr:Nucleoporin Nup133/Nup155-like N-terminal [Trinorchestia longiramus]